MGNRFLRILRKQNAASEIKIPEVVHQKPYSQMTHREYVNELTFLMDELGVERLSVQNLQVFVHIHKVA